MNTENNITDISHRLKRALKDRQREDGVMFSESFDVDRSDADCPTHIEVYSGGDYLAGTAGLCVTINSTSTLIMLTAEEAIELGQALFQAAWAETLP